MVFLASEILVVGLIILGLHALKGRLGLTLIFVFVASNQFVQNLLASTVYVEVLDRYTVSPGSAVLFSSSLFALLLIYLKEDIATTRSLIYGILLANLTLALVALSTRWAVASGQLEQIVSAFPWFRHYDFGGFLLGTGLLIVDAFLLIIGYEVLRSRIAWIPEWGRIVLSLSLVLSFDTLVFVGLVFRGDPGIAQMLVGGLLGKTLAGVLYGTLLWGYLEVSREAPWQEESREIRDPLSILTFGERYRLLQQEVGTLERLRERERQRAEVALRGARLGAWDWQIQTGETFHDDRWEEMLGYSREGIEPRIESWEDRIHPEDRDRVMTTLNAHLDGSTPFYEVEQRLRTRSGDWKWILSMGKVVEWDGDGKPERMTGTHMDIHERKLAEEALEASEASLAAAQRIARLGSWDWNIVSGELIWSDEIYRIFGLTPQQFGATYEAFLSYVHPDDRTLVQRSVDETLDGTEPYSIDHRIIRRDGSESIVHEQAEVVRDADGKPVRMVGTVQDITERKRAESELEALERRYRELFEGAPLKYVITKNHDGVPFITDCNSTFLVVLGYERDEVIGRPLSDFYTSESSRELLERGGYQRALDGVRIQSERQLVTKSGEVVETLLRAIPEMDADGKVIGTRAMYVDITERKRVEQALAESEASLVEAQRLARIGDWESSLVTEDNRWSEAMYEIFGVTPGEFTPNTESFLERLHPDDRDVVKDSIDALLEHHEPYEIEYRLVRPDGAIRTLHAVVRLDLDHQGVPVRLRGTTQDITERKQVEEELRHSGDQLRRLAARLEAIREDERKMMAREIHDELGQTLTGLKMDLAWLGNKIGEGQSGLRERVESMISMVDQTIEEVGSLSSRLRPAVLDDLGLGEAIEWQAREFSSRSGIECVVDLSASADSHFGCPPDCATMVFRILQEALTNTLRHAEATRVEVTLCQVGSQLVLRVSDNGKGIDPDEVLARNSLGLLGMRERAEQFGGTVEVGPSATRGTIVSARIPL